MVRDRASLPSNEAGSPHRLTSLVKKIRNQDIIERYDQVIQDQIDAGIVERVTGPANEKRSVLHPSQGSDTRLSRDYQASSSLRRVSKSIYWCAVIE